MAKVRKFSRTNLKTSSMIGELKHFDSAIVNTWMYLQDQFLKKLRGLCDASVRRKVVKQAVSGFRYQKRVALAYKCTIEILAVPVMPPRILSFSAACGSMSTLLRRKKKSSTVPFMIAA